MGKKVESRGRPAENDTPLVKFKVETEGATYHFDRTIHKGGTTKVVNHDKSPLKDTEIIANQTYTPGPVTLVFKTSNRKNAKTKIKVFKSKNIDWVNSTKKIAGVPANAVFLELGVGEKFLKKCKEKYG
jgi:hypothetical protein